MPVDVAELGCDFFAASGQKWLCGPLGTGSLWIAPEWAERLAPLGLTYTNLDDPAAGLDAHAVAGARRPRHADARAGDGAAGAGSDRDARRRRLATAPDTRRGARGAARGRARGARADRRRARPDDARLVGVGRPQADVSRLAEQDVVVRSFPNMPYVRAAVGGWNDERDLERLLAALG